MPLNKFWKSIQSTASEETETLLPQPTVSGGTAQGQLPTYRPVLDRAPSYDVPDYTSLKSCSRYPSVILTEPQKRTLQSRADTLTKQLIHMSHFYSDGRALGVDLSDHYLAGSIDVFSWPEGRPEWLDKNSKLRSSALHHNFSIPSITNCLAHGSCFEAKLSGTNLSDLTASLLRDARKKKPGLEDRQTSLLYIAQQLQKMMKEGRYGEMACKIPEWRRKMTDDSPRAFSACLLSRPAQTDASRVLKRHTLGGGSIVVPDVEGT